MRSFMMSIGFIVYCIILYILPFPPWGGLFLTFFPIFAYVAFDVWREMRKSNQREDREI